MTASGRNDGPDACEVLAGLWQLVQSVLDEAEHEFEALGLSPKTFFLLSAVQDHPFPAAIARRMHLPPPTVTYMIKQLEEKGLLGRQAEPGDLRKFRLVQTRAGQEALRRAEDVLGANLSRRLKGIGRDDLRTFARVVATLAAANGQKS